MKKQTVLFCAILVSVIFICATLESPPQKYDVFTALEKKLISVMPVSAESSSENCATLNVRNLSGSPLTISIPVGAILNTTNESEQDILVTRPIEIFVKNNETGSGSIYGFCCQAGNSVPTSASAFRLEKCKSENLMKLSGHLAENNYDPMLEQAAIWAVSDDHSVGGIYGGAEQETKKLREFTAHVLGQEVPFYDVDYGYELNTQFVYEPKELRGTLHFQLDNGGKGTLKILDPKGEEFYVFYTDKSLQWGFFTQNFRFKAYDMEAGDYVAQMIVDGKVVDEKTIRI
ncbi:MAG: hypothetical protein SH856_10325 [Flavobacteriales bacterium]|nr:hypothetical protein [Flavobacteriales bacterium]